MSKAAAVFKRTLFSELILTGSAGVGSPMSPWSRLCPSSPTCFSNFVCSIFSFRSRSSSPRWRGYCSGPVCGFAACYIGDFLGYVYNSWGQLYMPWVGLSTGMLALLAGLVFTCLRFKFRGSLYVKLALVCALSLFICTIGINTTGFYLYFREVGFSDKAIEAITGRLGTGVTYWSYAIYRLFIGGQIWNCLVNYVLLFSALPLLNRIRFFGVQLY